MKRLKAVLFAFCAFACLPAAGSALSDSLSKVLLKCAEDTNKVNVYAQLAWELRNSDPDTALYFANKGAELGEKLDYRRGLAACLNNSGVVYYLTSRFREALRNFDHALLLYVTLRDNKAMGRIYNNVGNIYRAQSDFPQAVRFLMKGLKIREEMGDSSGMSSSYNNIGLVYSDQGNNDMALVYFRKSLQIKENLDDNSGIYFTCTNIGMIYYKKNLFQMALDEFEQALEICLATNNKIGLANTYSNIGDVYHEQDDFPMAMQNFQKAMEVAEEIGDLGTLAHVYTSLGNTYLKMGGPARAIELQKKAIGVALKTGLKSTEMEAYKVLSAAYEESGRPAEALSAYKSYTRLKDDILNEQNSEKLAEMSTRFDVENKEKEINLLTKDNEIKNLAVSKNEADLKKQKLLNYSVFGGLVLVLLLAFFIYRSSREKQRANKQLEEKNGLIEQKNKEITDSILYAEKIQRALLPGDADFEQLFPDSFVLFRPKDIVSGDFYWIAKQGDLQFYVTADCTGHGVPGSFMSMLGTSLLNEIVLEKKVTDPAEVLDLLRIKIIMALKQTGASGENKDGMDMVFCCLDKKKKQLTYAAANNPLWILRKGEVLEFEADKEPVGVSVGESNQFNQHVVKLEEGDVIYTFTDGYADQFGGEKGKKFKYKQLKELLLANARMPLASQKQVLEDTITMWQGDLEQVDDMLVIGVKP